MICPQTNLKCRHRCSPGDVRCLDIICPNDGKPCACTSNALCLEGDGPRPRTALNDLEKQTRADNRCPNNGQWCRACKPDCCALNFQAQSNDPLNEGEMPQASPFTSDRNPVVNCHNFKLPCICDGTLCRRHGKIEPMSWRTCPVSHQPCTDGVCQGESLCRLHTSDFVTYRGVRALFNNTGADGWSWSFTLGDVKFGGVSPMPDAMRAFREMVDAKMNVLRTVNSVSLSESPGGR